MWRSVADEKTPEGRIAAAAANLMIEMRQTVKHEPDYADFRDRLKPYIERELITVRLRELARTEPGALSWEWRRAELRGQLEALERRIESIEGR